jgi:hypothetical protein
LGHALGEHHLAVIAVCLKPSLSRWALETGHIKQNLVVSSGLQAHGCNVMGDFSVEYLGLSRPPRLGRFLAPLTQPQLDIGIALQFSGESLQHIRRAAGPSWQAAREPDPLQRPHQFPVGAARNGPKAGSPNARA